MRTIFKVFTEFVTILLLFHVLVFWLPGLWDLHSPTRDWTCTPCSGRRSLHHWTAREVPCFTSFDFALSGKIPLLYLWVPLSPLPSSPVVKGLFHANLSIKMFSSCVLQVHQWPPVAHGWSPTSSAQHTGPLARWPVWLSPLHLLAAASQKAALICLHSSSWTAFSPLPC